MKPQLGMLRKEEMDFRSGAKLSGAIGARENGIANASALLFQVIEQAARPDKLRRKDSQTEQNGKPSRSRRDDHHDAQREQREAEENLQKAFRLLQTLNDHLFSDPNQLDAALALRVPTEYKARGLPITRSLADGVFAADNEVRLMLTHLERLLDSNSGKFFPCEG
jgi:hypothetical protein